MTTTINTEDIAAPYAHPEPALRETGSKVVVLRSPYLADTIRAALQDMPRCQPGDTKDHIRSMHETARQHHLADHEKWTRNARP